MTLSVNPARRPSDPSDGAASAPSTPAGPATAAPRTGRRWTWLGLVPVLGYVALFFLIPIVLLLVNAFKDSDSGAFTGANELHSLQGAYLTGLGHSIQVSIVDALLAAALGLPLAYAILTGRGTFLPRLVASASAVLANFGGLPLAFLFVAAIGNAGILTLVLQQQLHLSVNFNLYGVSGVELVYLYFMVPLMVLVITPALEGLRPQWREAADNLGASRFTYWRLVVAPVLAPSVLGGMALMFCSAFSAYATADALTNGTLSLISLNIGAVLSGNVITGQENVGAALALNMIIVVVPLTLLYQAMQRRTLRWLQ